LTHNQNIIFVKQGNLSHLQNLDLASNDFHGEIPHSICSTTIMQLFLANITLMEQFLHVLVRYFDENLFKSFVFLFQTMNTKKKKKNLGDLPLRYLELKYNELHGTIPKTLYFLSGLGAIIFEQ